MKHITSLLFSLVTACAVWFTPAAATQLFGHCVGVTDGDTCTLLSQQDGQKTTTRIRFHGIDAPESHQDFGQAAKKHLSGLIYDQDITVEVVDIDRYGRTVGKVFVGDTNVNLAMVQAGMAWWYRPYGAGETALQQAESDARSARHGLWQAAEPVAPWDFRHPKAAAGECLSHASSNDGRRYWVTASSGKTHNASCRYYANSNGYYSATGTGNNCKICGGDNGDSSAAPLFPQEESSTAATNAKRYWVTSSSGKTHNASCRYYANSNGYYSATGTGNNCKICGGAR